MPREKFELSDITTTNSQTNLTMNGVDYKKSGGCYVSGIMGFILLLLALIVAVGVGLIVHFAGGNKDLMCHCDCGGAASASAIKQECEQMATDGNADICSKCPGSGDMHPTTSTVTVAPTTPAKVTDVRLPTSVLPMHYDVELQPNMYTGDPKTFTFKGKVKILVRCEAPTDNITMHINILTVSPESIKFSPETPSGDDPQYLNWAEDKDRQFFIVKLTKNMMANRNYTVEMSFTSPLTNTLNGLYYSTYSRGNETIYLATTQFQPTDARKAFPCFDEPALKATFSITLVRPDYLISISNMPIIDSSETFTEGGINYVKDVYQRTPKMSSYLLAFVVSDFQYTSNRTVNDVLYRAWATPETVNQTFYSLDVGIKVLTHFEEYFDIPYPLPKQDMIAIPDFAAGAMENWGLITYRETAMLYEPGISNAFNKERVAIVVSHELAHQWFGDLVSPSWWDDLWLNEGFASFMEYMGVDYIHPDWRMFEKFVYSDLQRAFSFDGLISSHPIYVPVAHPDEINEIFDTISYSKGASVIRMMRHFLGLDTFRRGMHRYLSSKEYDAAFHDDLWTALTAQARIDRKNIDVKAIMDTWTLQMNYPVVTVSRDFHNHGTLKVQQKRYLVDYEAEDPGKYQSSFGYRWTIPLTFTSSKNPRFTQTDQDIHWMYHTDEIKDFDLGTANLPEVDDTRGWFLANVEQNGYYRVNYPTENWARLCDQLKEDHAAIPVINRAQIINDAWNLAKSGDLDLNTALMTIEYLDQERDYVPWRAVRTELSYVANMLSLTSLYGRFGNFMRDKLNSSYEFFGLDNTGASHIDSQARATIASSACGYGIQACRDAASSQYKQWMENSNVNPIDPNLKSVIYCNAIRNGGWAEWDFALKMYKEANVAAEKSNLLSAMGCSTTPWILNHYMNILLDENSPIRSQDALDVISYVSVNTVGRPLAWNFFRGQYDLLHEKFGSSFFSWTSIIGTVTSSFNTQLHLDEVKAFKQSKSENLGTGARAFDQAVEKIQGNIKWMTNNKDIIDNWLKSKGYE